MSVIQKIRDKYATVMIFAICISLVAFLLMDALVGPKSFFHNSNDIAQINGTGIDYKDYSTRLQQAKEIYKENNPDATMDDAVNDRLENQVWTQVLNEQIMGAEFDKLGIAITPAELQDLEFTQDADPQIRSIKAFADPQTGMFDPSRVREFLQSLQTGDPSDPRVNQNRNQWIQINNYIEKTAPQEKFYSLVREGIYYPKWLVERETKESTTYAYISYVSIPYGSISDSSVSVTDKELEDYLEAHQQSFQQEQTERLEYVNFDAIPTSVDSASILKQMVAMKAELATTSDQDIAGYINRNSETQFLDGYLPLSIIQVPDKDSIVSMAPGQMFGPYYDNRTITVAKMIDKKTMPDTVKVRTILISSQNIPDSVAQAKVDSIAQAVRGGADFAEMASRFSDDPGSKSNGGQYTITAETPFIPEFKNFAFQHKTGDMDTLKSQQYGYFLIKIEEQKNFEPAFKIAYLSRAMEPSQETDNTAYSEASAFAGQNHDQQSFDKSALMKGYNKQIADNVQNADYTIQGIGQCRDLIRWAFGAKKGDVSQVFTYDNRYVVAVVTGLRKKGTASLDDVRIQVEAEVKREKKAARIAAAIKPGTTLEQLSRTEGQPVSQAQHVNFETPFLPNAGLEPKVIGAVFDPSIAPGKASPPISGNNAVYVIRVDSIQVQSNVMTPSLAERSLEMNMQQQLLGQVFDALKKQAKITDNRLKFF
jgi:peptidyl-prolyl cis-trans isomerase D